MCCIAALIAFLCSGVQYESSLLGNFYLVDLNTVFYVTNKLRIVEFGMFLYWRFLTLSGLFLYGVVYLPQPVFARRTDDDKSLVSVTNENGEAELCRYAQHMALDYFVFSTMGDVRRTAEIILRRLEDMGSHETESSSSKHTSTTSSLRNERATRDEELEQWFTKPALLFTLPDPSSEPIAHSQQEKRQTSKALTFGKKSPIMVDLKTIESYSAQESPCDEGAPYTSPEEEGETNAQSIATLIPLEMRKSTPRPPKRNISDFPVPKISHDQTVLFTPAQPGETDAQPFRKAKPASSKGRVSHAATLRLPTAMSFASPDANFVTLSPFSQTKQQKQSLQRQSQSRQPIHPSAAAGQNVIRMVPPRGRSAGANRRSPFAYQSAQSTSLVSEREQQILSSKEMEQELLRTSAMLSKSKL